VEVQWKVPRASVLGSLRRDHERDDTLKGAAFQPWELTFYVFSACVWGLAIIAGSQDLRCDIPHRSSNGTRDSQVTIINSEAAMLR
jgi:hypothetical protein